MIFEKIEEKFCQWNHRFKAKLLSLCPPGYELTGEYRAFWIWISFSSLYSLKFLINYSNAYDNLFYRTGAGVFLNTKMRMLQFGVLVEDSFHGFLLGIICLAFVFVRHFNYYRKDSKSIFLVKRLRDRKFVWKTYLGTPFVYGMIFLMAALLLLGLYYGIYRLVTPEICLVL